MPTETVITPYEALTEQVADAVFRASLIATFAQMANHLLNADAGPGAGPLS